MNILAYVQMRNIHGSTGHGRVARQIIEHLALDARDRLHILADPADHERVVRQVGAPWTDFPYHFFRSETSRQTARWLLTGRPRAEQYWPQAQITYCANETYIPTRSTRLVVTLHDAGLFENRPGPHDWRFGVQRAKSRYLYNALSRKADLIHTVSNYSLERLGHFFPGFRSRLRVVPNAVSPCFFAPPSTEGESFLRAHKLTDRLFLVLPGGLNYRKNARLVLSAWPLIHQLHPELKLVVVGHNSPDYVTAAEALGASVTLTGFVDDEILCALYHSAQVVWFPSLYEGFGLPVLEGMACGTPVVASDATAIPEIAGDAALLASATSVAEHVEAIDSLLKDPRQRHALRERGKTRAGQFTWPRTVSELREHFLSLI